MMKRLVEQTDSRHPLVARAAKLLLEAQPLAPSDATRRRVLASVVREHFAARRPWLLRPAAVFAMLLATTAAAASFHDAWLPRMVRIVVDRAGPRSWQRVTEARRPQTESAKVAGRAALAVDETSAAPSDTALEAAVEASLLVNGVVAAEHGVAPSAEADIALDPGDARARASRRAIRRSKAIAPQAWDDGAGLVVSAIEVLRHQHDAARASQMLEQYLGSHPRGALREEAMALAVEAASARGDSGESRRLAARYDHAFPDGRFRPALRASAAHGSL